MQPEYAARGIATFPTGETKKPSIRGWQKVGLKGSTQLAAKFINADALGYVTGQRSRVTVLDIDTTDERVLTDALNRHGQPAIITRTALGKFHCLYRYNGEHRRIRPCPELPIDILGDHGYAVAAPSKIATGSYEIIHGHLGDLANLKPMAGLEAAVDGPEAVPMSAKRLQGMREHDGRNTALFMALGPTARKVHQACGTRDEVLEIARKYNAQCAQPMGDEEVSGIVGSIWGMTLEGRNIIGLPTAFCLTHKHLSIDDSDAFKLLAFLRAHQGPSAHFMCANGLARRPEFGWDEKRVGRARRILVEQGYLIPVRQAGRGHAALFRWDIY